MTTAACSSSITELDGDNGILRYRGYPIEQLAERSTYLEVTYLLIHGDLPTAAQFDAWRHEITYELVRHGTQWSALAPLEEVDGEGRC